ncbi:DUF7144 family membrane protein [Streptomyces sp. NBC_00659]|uniref:DUF7144 family membrane protein n=1 Tax=Streptomyces sp. NBC_00659 TaxID=2903669 RepID=UPI003FCC3DA5
MANFPWLPYYPFWALVLIAIDIFVIWRSAPGRRGRPTWHQQGVRHPVCDQRSQPSHCERMTSGQHQHSRRRDHRDGQLAHPNCSNG